MAIICLTTQGYSRIESLELLQQRYDLVVSGGVIDDTELPVIIVLAQDRLETVFQVFRRWIMDRQQDRHKRLERTRHGFLYGNHTRLHTTIGCTATLQRKAPAAFILASPPVKSTPYLVQLRPSVPRPPSRFQCGKP